MRLETFLHHGGGPDLDYWGEVRPGPVRKVETVRRAADANPCLARVETFLSDLILLVDDLRPSTDHRSIIVKVLGDADEITEIIIDLTANRGAVLISVGHSSDRTEILGYDKFYAEYPGGPVDDDPHSKKSTDEQRIFKNNWRAFTVGLAEGGHPVEIEIRNGYKRVLLSVYARLSTVAHPVYENKRKVIFENLVRDPREWEFKYALQTLILQAIRHLRTSESSKTTFAATPRGKLSVAPSLSELIFSLEEQPRAHNLPPSVLFELKMNTKRHTATMNALVFKRQGSWSVDNVTCRLESGHLCDLRKIYKSLEKLNGVPIEGNLHWVSFERGGVESAELYLQFNHRDAPAVARASRFFRADESDEEVPSSGSRGPHRHRSRSRSPRV